MNLRDLEVFRAVVREGGITRAAAALGRVQSSVTARIQQLEAELGTALFLREGKRMSVSPSGRVLLDYAERLLALAEEARAAVTDPRPRGPFRLGAMESTAAVRLPGPLTEYCRRHPEVALTLRTGNPQALAGALMAGSLDAALFAEPVAEARFEWAPAFAERLVLVAPAGHPPIGPACETPDTIIVFETGCPHRARLEGWYAARGDLPRQTVELASYHAMFGSVVAGMGVALMPESVLAAFPERARVSTHALPAGEDMLHTRLVWRRGTRSPKIDALIAVLEDAAAA
ncbi:MAG: LysR family transcriptional regulator [Pseudomonadota bacterium]